jgi:hypothetical protein
VPPSLACLLRRVLRPVVIAAALILPLAARAQPTSQWIGVWSNGEEHTTLTITGGTLSLAWPDTPVPERYQWTGRLYASPDDLARWNYAPGYYFGFDARPVTAAAIRAALDAAWGRSLILDAANPATAARYAVLRARVDRIRPGSYRRIRRFCVNDRRAKTDCLAGLRNEFFIADGDRLVLVLIDPAAPQTSNVLAFDRVRAVGGRVGR